MLIIKVSQNNLVPTGHPKKGWVTIPYFVVNQLVIISNSLETKPNLPLALLSSFAIFCYLLLQLFYLMFYQKPKMFYL